MQLIVVGMHRSGTSVLARLLNLMGAYFGVEGIGTGANEENPKGFWERRDVRALNDRMLHSVGCDWNRVSRFDASKIPTASLAEFEKRASQIVLSMDANRPWFIKEPRLCLLLPLWRRVMESPLCIHILRHPLEVAASLMTRNQIPIPAGLALWEFYNRSALAGMEGLENFVVRHRDLMDRPVETVAETFEQLKSRGVRRLTLPSDSEVRSFLSDELYREREGDPRLGEFAKVEQVRMFDLWSADKPSSGVFHEDLSPSDMAALSNYESSLGPMRPANAVAKRPPEAELAELRVAADAKERENQALSAQLHQRQAELERMIQQSSFLKTEFQALREGSLSREASSGELLFNLQKMLADRDQSLQEAELSLERAQEALQARDRDGAFLSKQMADTLRVVEQLTKQYSESQDIVAKLKVDVAEARMCAVSKQASDSLQRAGLEAAKRGMRAEIEVLQLRISGLEEDLQSKAEEASLFKQVADFYVAELSRLDGEMIRLRSSFSWKITLPMRLIRARLRRFRGANSCEPVSTLDVIRNSKWFDADWYAAKYPDVRESGVSPEVHFLTKGAADARKPSGDFDTAYYIKQNPDVVAAKQNPLIHFILYGEREGRLPRPKSVAD